MGHRRGAVSGPSVSGPSGNRPVPMELQDRLEGLRLGQVRQPDRFKGFPAGPDERGQGLKQAVLACLDRVWPGYAARSFAAERSFAAGSAIPLRKSTNFSLQDLGVSGQWRHVGFAPGWRGERLAAGPLEDGCGPAPGLADVPDETRDLAVQRPCPEPPREGFQVVLCHVLRIDARRMAPHAKGGKRSLRVVRLQAVKQSAPLAGGWQRL